MALVRGHGDLGGRGKRVQRARVTRGEPNHLTAP
jgi:hypothetical protein